MRQNAPLAASKNEGMLEGRSSRVVDFRPKGRMPPGVTHEIIQPTVCQTVKSRLGASRSWGSGSPGQVGDGIDFSIEQRFEAGSELAVEDSAADLEQEIGAAAGPSHRLGFVHAAVDQ